MESVLKLFWYTGLKTVTHPSTNWAQRRATSLACDERRYRYAKPPTGVATDTLADRQTDRLANWVHSQHATQSAVAATNRGALG